MIGIAQAAPTILASFVASLVEFIEALTIVLAVGTVRGWKPALQGTFLAAILLALLVILCGPSLATIPLTLVQLVVGILLLLFGMRWLRKAILRAGGALARHDEMAEFRKTSQALSSERPASSAPFDLVGIAAAFKAVALEGLEVVFIVIATGAATQKLGPAILGAGAAAALVIILGIALHRPLARVPENALKLTVGVLLSGFGVFWTGEGLGLVWPGADLALLWLVGGFFLAALIITQLIREPAMTPSETRTS